MNLSTLHKIATASYSNTPPSTIDTFSLVDSTPTLKFYRSGNTIVVGIRGTVPTDLDDVKADGSIALGLLSKTPRYQRDDAKLRQVKLANPTAVFVGVGHSLGGAILDEFLKRGLLSSGTSYNPAVQPTDFKSNLANRRIYKEGDPLYEIMGKNVSGVEVRKSKPSLLDRLIQNIPYVGRVLSSLQSHTLDNFEGGAATRRERVLKSYGLDPTKSYSLSFLAKTSKIPKRILQEVYNRGIGAYKTNPISVRMKGTFKKNVKAPLSKKLSKEQWAMARVFSFLDENPKHDTDLRGGGKLVVAQLDTGQWGLWDGENVFYLYGSKEKAEQGLANAIAYNLMLPYPKRDPRLFDVAATPEGRPLTNQDILAQVRLNAADKILSARDVKNVDQFLSEELQQERLPKSVQIDLAKERMERKEEEKDPVFVEEAKKMSGKGKASFEDQLLKIGYNPQQYLRDARRRAKANGYPPSRLVFADNGVHKLAITDDEGRVIRFGRVGYNDFLIWSHLERKKSVEKGTARAKQMRFVKSHSAMKGNWKSNDYSPNNLAIRILW